MRVFEKLRLRLRSLLRQGTVDSELDAELRFHLDHLVEENLSAGMSKADAYRAACRTIGNTTQRKEECRDMRRISLIEDFLQDVRYALRSLAKNPIFTAVAIATLALGIGANGAIFTIARSVLFRPLGYPHPEQLMYLKSDSLGIGPSLNAVSPKEYLEFRELNRAFADVGAFSMGTSGFATGEVNLTAGSRPIRVRSVSVDAHLLHVLGFQPAQGRLFNDEETTLGLGSLPPPIAIVSNELWRTAFGGTPLLGSSIEIEGRPHQIVGIMPPGADIMDNRTEVWLPIALPPGLLQNRGFHSLGVVARLKIGVTPAAARTELNALLQNWGERTGAANHLPTSRPLQEGDHSLGLEPLQDVVVGNVSRPIWVLQATVGVVLLIVCANLANFVLARAESRRREFALRASLGASRERLFRQALTEGLILSSAGAVLGMGLAGIGLQALTRSYPGSVPRASQIAIDFPVLLFALAVAAGTALVFGVANGPSKDLNTVLKEGGNRGSSGAGRHRVRQALVTVEVSLAVMLAIGAGLLLRTLYNLTAVDVGFDLARLVTFSMTVPQATSEPETRVAVYQRLLNTLRSQPGVQAATAMSGLPLNRTPQPIRTLFENYESPTGGSLTNIDYYQLVMSDYFSTMGIPITAGRGFEVSDASSTENVAVVNETLARRIWQGRNPIGQRIRVNLSASIGSGGVPWTTVIGVAKDVKQQGVEKETGTELYILADQHANALPTMNVVMRTTMAIGSLSQMLDRVMREVDPSIPVVRTREMGAVFAESIGRSRLLALLLGGFASIALLLAAGGTYGLLSFIVTERRREMGIRLALGASRPTVLAHVMRQGLSLCAVGMAIGLAAALGLNRLMVSLLFGVQPADTRTFLVVLLTIVIVALAASWLPARRASRLDPIAVLRDE